MKKFLIFVLVGFNITSFTYAIQYGFDGVNTTNCSPFVNFYDDFTHDWHASHGSPSLASGGRAVLGSSSNNNSSEGYGEGIYLNYNFLSTHTYSISVKLGNGTLDPASVEISAVNGMSPGGQFAYCNYELKPFYNDQYPLIYTSFITGETIQSKNNWKPNRNYSQIWITSTSNSDFLATVYYVDIVDHGVPDSQAPSTPSNLSASNITNNSFNVSWSPSTDNIGVVGYKLYDRNNVLVATTPSTNYTIGGRTPCTNNIVKVKAYDAAGNLSNAASITVNTTSNIPSELPLASLITTNVVTKEASNSILMTPGFEYTADLTSDYLLAHIVSGACSSYGTGLRMAAQESEEVMPVNLYSDNSFINESTGSISIFPNPATTKVKVNYSNDNIATIQVFDASGLLIKENQGSNVIDISDLETAIYFFKVTSADGMTATEKILKR